MKTFQSKTFEIIKQKARKLKRENGISHVRALDEIAQQYKFNHWNHLYKTLKHGLIIALDIKDAADFYDEKKRFVSDEIAYLICQEMLYLDYIESVDDDGISFKDKETEAVLKKEFEEYEIDNYRFFRYTVKTLPRTVDEVIKLTNECCFWQPRYIWLNGEFYNQSGSINIQ